MWKAVSVDKTESFRPLGIDGWTWVGLMLEVSEWIKNKISLLEAFTRDIQSTNIQNQYIILIAAGSAVLAILFISITLLLMASTLYTRIHCNAESAIYHSCQLGLDLTCEKIVDDMWAAISWLIYDSAINVSPTLD